MPDGNCGYVVLQDLPVTCQSFDQVIRPSIYAAVTFLVIQKHRVSFHGSPLAVLELDNNVVKKHAVIAGKLGHLDRGSKYDILRSTVGETSTRGEIPLDRRKRLYIDGTFSRYMEAVTIFLRCRCRIV